MAASLALIIERAFAIDIKEPLTAEDRTRIRKAHQEAQGEGKRFRDLARDFKRQERLAGLSIGVDIAQRVAAGEPIADVIQEWDLGDTHGRRLEAIGRAGLAGHEFSLDLSKASLKRLEEEALEATGRKRDGATAKRQMSAAAKVASRVRKLGVAKLRDEMSIHMEGVLTYLRHRAAETPELAAEIRSQLGEILGQVEAGEGDSDPADDAPPEGEVEAEPQDQPEEVSPEPEAESEDAGQVTQEVAESQEVEVVEDSQEGDAPSEVANANAAWETALTTALATLAIPRTAKEVAGDFCHLLVESGLEPDRWKYATARGMGKLLAEYKGTYAKLPQRGGKPSKYVLRTASLEGLMVEVTATLGGLDLQDGGLPDGQMDIVGSITATVGKDALLMTDEVQAVLPSLEGSPFWYDDDGYDPMSARISGYGDDSDETWALLKKWEGKTYSLQVPATHLWKKLFDDEYTGEAYYQHLITREIDGPHEDGSMPVGDKPFSPEEMQFLLYRHQSGVAYEDAVFGLEAAMAMAD